MERWFVVTYVDEQGKETDDYASSPTWYLACERARALLGTRFRRLSQELISPPLTSKYLFRHGEAP